MRPIALMRLLPRLPQGRIGRTNRRAENPRRLGGTRRRFESRLRRSDIGDVIGRLGRRSIVAHASFSYAFLRASSTYVPDNGIDFLHRILSSAWPSMLTCSAWSLAKMI